MKNDQKVNDSLCGIFQLRDQQSEQLSNGIVFLKPSALWNEDESVEPPLLNYQRSKYMWRTCVGCNANVNYNAVIYGEKKSVSILLPSGHRRRNKSPLPQI